MSGIILAAGAGRRLWPHTDGVPKALVPVDGATTIMDIALRNMAGVDIRDVAVVVGYAAEAVEDRRAALEHRHGVRLELVRNDRASEWNNCYSLWLARDYLAGGALLANGDTVHPQSVEEALLAGRGAGVQLAVDAEKPLAEEEMKVSVDADGRLGRINKRLDPATAYSNPSVAACGRPMMPLTASGVMAASCLPRRASAAPSAR